jgi:type II secretory pathway component PulJ
VLIALAIGAAFLAGFTGFYLQQQRAFREQQMEIETAQSLRTALDQIVRDLRSAGRNPAEINRWAGLLYADLDVVFITLDSNGDGDVSDADEVKYFQRTGDRIEMYSSGTITNMETLAQWIRPLDPNRKNPVFRYYRWDGTEFTDLPASLEALADIKRVDVTLTAERTLPDGRTISLTQSETVAFRNLP